jgi:hypothetical protein
MMTGLIVSTIVYFPALWLGSQLLERNDIELPRGPTRWVVLNTFAALVSYLASLPF